MRHSPSPSTVDADNIQYALELQDFLAELSQDPEREAVASEIHGKASEVVLQNFYRDLLKPCVCLRSPSVDLRRRRDSSLAATSEEWEALGLDQSERWDHPL
ncbi:hypothetical protein CVT25_008060 [Psilocybe cyanescens]|uniref:Uncharacterized protein n=1 Tax=Psilocybe cyanescens TaxID=93625 RepID=A0A409WUJ2_PSICY|nr:hypothetical protein CVT25_008060 [Psilocybe cyanescens]